MRRLSQIFLVNQLLAERNQMPGFETSLYYTLQSIIILAELHNSRNVVFLQDQILLVLNMVPPKAFDWHFSAVFIVQNLTCVSIS